ncbi:MAG TPA: hypothetical protein DFR83_17825 [Deltaproteobacteria bacterium]|mgnify:CR=1 FL=1|nr:hypothetical protein [Deltaproteobacteria bacterium]
MILLGRLHALVVHFPIALLLVAVALAVWARKKGQPLAFMRPLLGLGAISAIAAVATGLILADEQTFFGVTARQLSWHRNLGIATAIVSSLAALAAFRRMGVAVALTVVGALTVGAGAHFGGVLVHGDDHFVVSTAPKRVGGSVSSRATKQVARPPVIAEVDEIPTPVPFAMVDHVFKRSCIRCHDARKRKGEFRLDRQELALKGGSEGIGIVPGNRGRSLVFERVSLPQDHDDYMPTKGQPLTAAEVELVGRWIDEGAVWN